MLLSATEDEDKPLKYPTIFNNADVVVLTRMSFAPASDFDEAPATCNIQTVRPAMEVLKASAKTGDGMAEYPEVFESSRVRSRTASEGSIE